MKVLIISDVHGNLPALEHVIKKESDSDLIISLGDVVNYGPWSNECVDLVSELESKILIKGNHEEAFLSGIYPGKHPIAKAFYEKCYPTFDRKKELEAYQEEYFLQGNRFTHTVDDAYIFPDSEVSIETNTFIGHSHRIFSKNCEGKRLVNVGSVGQNRLDIDKVNYVIWNTEKDTINLVEKSFSADSMIQEMKAQNYSDTCLNYILSKRKNE